MSHITKHVTYLFHDAALAWQQELTAVFASPCCKKLCLAVLVHQHWLPA
jgi:hypothetical protein